MRAMRFAAGVHASGGFGIGGPIYPATPFPGPNEEVYVQSLVDQLQWRVRKEMAIRSLLLHVLLVAVIVTISAVRDQPTTVKGTNRFVQNQVFLRQRLSQATTLREVLAEYGPAVLENCWRTRGNRTSSVIALHTVAIRQLRLRTRPMRSTDSYQRNSFEASHFPWNFSTTIPLLIDDAVPLTVGRLDHAPIANTVDQTKPFLSNRGIQSAASTNGTGFSSEDASLVFTGNTILTVEHTFPQTDRSYSVFPPLFFSEINSTSEITNLLANKYADAGWLSSASLALVFDAILFEPSESYFYSASAVAQMDSAVRLISTVISHPYQVHSLNKDHFRNSSVKHDYLVAVILTILDGLLLLLFIAFVYEGVTRVRTKHRLEGSWVSALFCLSEIHDFLVSLLIIGTIGGHIWLTTVGSVGVDLNAANTTQSQKDMTSFRFLSEYGNLDHRVTVLRSWTTLAILLRTLFMMQFISRLAVVTETIRSSAQDIIGVAVLFFGTLFAFAFSGVFLFGSNFQSYSSIVEAVTFFTQLIGSGELHGFREHERTSWTASLYYLFFFFIAYFVLLNVIIGILAASFVTTVETFDLVKRADWSLEALRKDIVGIFRRILRKTQSEKTMTSSAWLDANFRLLDALRALAASDSAATSPGDQVQMTLRQLRSVGSSFFAADELESLFSKAQAQVGTRNGKVRHVRLLSRRMKKGTQIMEEVASQSRQVQEIWRGIIGEDAREAASEAAIVSDDGELGDDDVGMDDDNEVVSGSGGVPPAIVGDPTTLLKAEVEGVTAEIASFSRMLENTSK